MPFAALLLAGTAGFLSRGAWSRWLGIWWDLLLAAVHAPIYAVMATDRKAMKDMEKRVMKVLHDGFQMTHDRMDNMEERQNQGARELENLREKLPR